MSDLPELNLFEEIQGLANSSHFYTYTQDEFNNTWSYYEDETDMDTKDHSTSFWVSPARNIPTSPSSGKSSPTRDTWDPMLWHTRSLEEVELRALAEMGPLSPPLSPVVMPTVSTISDVTPVFEANAAELIATTISAAELSVSGSVTGSNQLLLSDKRSRSDRSESETKSGNCLSGGQRTSRATWRKQSKKESQIVSRRRGINYPPKKLYNSFLSRRRTKKLYEMKPFADPLQERERQNAINAKKNRDKKKSIESHTQNEIDQLRALNKRLNKEAAMEKRKLYAARKEIKLLKSKLESSSIQTR